MLGVKILLEQNLSGFYSTGGGFSYITCLYRSVDLDDVLYIELIFLFILRQDEWDEAQNVQVKPTARRIMPCIVVKFRVAWL